MEFNLQNLSPSEFEKLCCDILSIFLGKKFRTFSDGKDGGIDIKLISGTDDIIGQCKRYSSQSVLMRELPKELKKIKNKNCTKYYIFCACELSVMNHDKIFDTFKEYMESQNNIFDGNRICSLLALDEYKNVLEHHFKLWATNEKVFELLNKKEIGFDSSVLISNIQEHKKYYVETSSYNKIFNCLLEDRCVLVKGAPGVGKTTVSEMAILSMISKFNDIKLIYSSYGNISSIKDRISNSDKTKELIYVDDFLGQVYFDIKNERISNLISLIEGIRLSKNKYLLLNTRITVLNEACNKSRNFLKSVNKMNIKQIDVNDLSYMEKAKILYNHIYFSDMDINLKRELLEDGTYLKIVKHKNYNPRIIEYITDLIDYNQSTDGKYINYVANMLKNPKQIWTEPYQERLGEIDRIFLLTLYGISSNSVKMTIHRKAFEGIIRNVQGIDITINNYENCCKRLVDSFVYIVYDNDSTEQIIKVLNPSINEVIGERFELFNTPIYKDNLVVFEQYLNAYKKFSSTKLFENMILNGILNTLLYNNGNYYHALMLYFESNNHPNEKLRINYIDLITKDYYIYSKYTYGSNITNCYSKILSKNNISLYSVDNINMHDFKKILKNIINIFKVEKIMDYFLLFDYNNIKQAFEDKEISDMIIEKIIMMINPYQIISDLGGDIDELKQNTNFLDDELFENVLYELKNNNCLIELLKYLQINVTESSIYEAIENIINWDDELDEYLKDVADDMSDAYHEYLEEKYYDEQDEEKAIIELFENMY